MKVIQKLYLLIYTNANISFALQRPNVSIIIIDIDNSYFEVEY